MKKLRLGFVDTFGAVEEFFTEVLSREYEIERDDDNPEYLIFGDYNFGSQNKLEKYHRDGITRIFYTGENERPDRYHCHYAISFDHTEFYNYRLPLFVIYDWDNKRKGVTNSDNVGRPYYTGNPRGFCSFVVKNGGCEKRNEFFHRLNAYKPVASAGPLFNNTGFLLERGAKAVEAKAEFLPKYKFNLCFENSSYPGYATEKLYEALMFDTVPIYWGSPTIALDFNPRAFLSWHDYQDDDKFFERIKEVDQDESQYLNMYHADAFVNFEKPVCFDLDRLVFWWNKNVYKL
jgi:hypothetical protein